MFRQDSGEELLTENTCQCGEEISDLSKTNKRAGRSLRDRKIWRAKIYGE